MKPIRIQRKRTKGFDLQAESKAANGLECVYVGRPTKWGNPFMVGDCVEYESNYWLWESNDYLKSMEGVLILDVGLALEVYEAWVKEKIFRGELNVKELRGKNLACWCALDKPCHADILLFLANREI